ncbi:MAG: hypothetical protein H0X65_10565 [Gemmatimonadetes bacterium]|nr:hypothetical protein [Gemmatimonadota bacterium]
MNNVTLRGLVLAPYGRDAELLSDALTECGARPVVCRGLDGLLVELRSESADLLVISDDAFVGGGDDRLLAVLRDRTPDSDDILPLVLLTASTKLVHPLTSFPGVVVTAKPTRRRILGSILRGALDTRRRVLQLQEQRRKLAEQNRSLGLMTEELESRNLGLLDAMQAKDRFVSTMSHELRTPLNAVLSYADLLDLGIHGALNEQQSAYVERIVTSARHLLELIGDVLDAALLNAGELQVESGPLDLWAELGDVVALMAPEASAKGLHLTVQPPSEPLPPVSGDRLRVRQVLLNLVSNAIKFTDRGGVTIQLELNGGDTVSVIVRDTGSGIGPDELPRVFQDFYQVAGGLNRRHDGSGLGLAISKRLALLMGGELSVESELGQGSVFTFTLPLVPE